MSDESSSSATQTTRQHDPLEADTAPENAWEEELGRDGATDFKACVSRVHRKRILFLDDLLQNLHTIVCTHLVVIYYLDNSFVRLVLRAGWHMMSLAPGNPTITQVETQPYLIYLFAPNIICLLCRAYFAAPSAGEETRFYLHGGLSIDFIGQSGPTSKIRLALLDLFIFVLQTIMLSVLLKQRALAGRIRTAVGSPLANPEQQRARSIEESEREEMGLSRQLSLDSMSPSERGDEHEYGEIDEEYGQSRRAVGDGAEAGQALEVLDALTSGQATVASLYVLNSIREIYQAHRELDTARQRRPQAFSAGVSGRFSNWAYRLRTR